MRPAIIDTKDIPRRFRIGFPVSRIGFLFPNHPQAEAAFTGKLEFCLRLSSADGSPACDVIDGIRYTTPFPHVVLKLPDSVHSYAIHTDREAVYVQYPPELEQAMRETGLFGKPRIWQVSLTPELHSLLRKLRENLDCLLEPGVIDRIDQLCLQLALELVGQDVRQEGLPPEIQQKIDRIASYFHLHFAEDFDLEKLLRNNGLSRRSFQRHWKKLHRLPPSEYLRQLKLQHVKMLLAESPLPVYQIARKANFPHTYYMCRLFRERFGLTPLQYRKCHRG